MTLIEVIVAISIMGIIATASIGLSITSQTSAAAQQRQELAVAIANQAMESVSAQPTVASAILVGRTQSSVTSNWNDTINTTTGGIGSTYAAWDATATATSIPVVPILSTVIQSGTTYETNTLIGTCYQRTDATGTCTKVAGYTAPALPQPAGWSPILRVIVVVRWHAGTGCTGVGGCSYSTTSLIDPHVDLPWDTH